MGIAGKPRCLGELRVRNGGFSPPARAHTPSGRFKDISLGCGASWSHSLTVAQARRVIGPQMPRLYRTVSNGQGWSGLPDYEIRDGKFYRTINNALGWSGLPDYEIRASGKVYRTVTHPNGWSGLPDYEFRNNDGRMYRTVSHPEGWSGLPDYEIRS